MSLTEYQYRDGFSQLSFGPSLSPAVKRLIAATIICFVVQNIGGGVVDRTFALVPALAVPHLYLWQFATYIFLHANLIHLLFNMFVLWMFGPDVEGVLGTRRFTYFYFFCGIGAGLCSVLFYPPATFIMGASGAIFGLMVAFAMLFPERVVTLLLFFVLPVNMKAKHLVLIFAGLELLLVISNVRGDFVAHFAHLGGALFGYLYMGWWGRGGGRFGVRGSRRWKLRNGAEDNDSVDRSERVDRILDKVSSHGMPSLTEEEKAILRQASTQLF